MPPATAATPCGLQPVPLLVLLERGLYLYKICPAVLFLPLDRWFVMAREAVAWLARLARDLERLAIHIPDTSVQERFIDLELPCPFHPDLGSRTAYPGLTVNGPLPAFLLLQGELMKRLSPPHADDLSALNGCGLLGDSLKRPEYKPSPVENFMANAVPGDITTLSDPAFGTDVRVSMEDSFFLRRWRRMQACHCPQQLQRGRDHRCLRRNAEGQWRLAPPCLGPGHAPRCRDGFPDGRGQGISPDAVTMKKPVFFLLLYLLLLPQGVCAADAPAPYGANLFQGNFGQGGTTGAMAPGDRSSCACGAGASTWIPSLKSALPASWTYRKSASST